MALTLADKRKDSASTRRADTAGGSEGRERTPLENTKSCVSAPGQRPKKLKKAKLTREDFKRLESSQKEGYARVGIRHSVKQCGSIPVVKNVVGLGISGAGALQVAGLHRCTSRWCPDCFGKLSRARNEEVKKVFDWAIDAGHSVVLVTLTAGHFTKKVLANNGGDRQKALRSQDNKELADGLVSAWRVSQQGRGGRRLADGRIGYIRSYEITVDEDPDVNFSGFHSHFHCLFILDKSVNLEEYKELIFSRWKVGCDKAGLITSMKGYDFRPLTSKDASVVSAYLVKGEKITKKIAGEIASPQAKITAGKGRISPEGLLRKIGDMPIAEVPKWVAYWRKIETSLVGKRWLTWSRNIRLLAGVGEEESDESIILKEHAVRGDRVAVVPFDEVSPYLEEFREVILKEKEEKKWNTLLILLDTVGVPYVIQDTSDFYLRVAESMRNQGRPPD